MNTRFGSLKWGIKSSLEFHVLNPDGGEFMFDTDIEKTIVGTAIALWFAHGWYLNECLRSVHEKLGAYTHN